MVNNNGPVRLLVNQIGNAGPWLGALPVGLRERRALLGTRLGVHRQGAATLWRRCRTDGSYASAQDPRSLVGTGAAAVTRLEVRWLGGGRSAWSEPPANRYLLVRRR